MILQEEKEQEAPTFLETPKIITLNKGKLVQMIARYEASEKCFCNWSKKGKLFSGGKINVRKIFIPILRDGNHWSCACVDTMKGDIYMCELPR